MALTKGRDSATLMIPVAAVASGTNRTDNVFVAPCKGFIRSAKLISNSDQAGGASSYRTWKLLDGGAAGTGTAVIASKAGTASWPGSAPQSFGTLYDSGSAYYLDAGDVVTLAMATVGADHANCVVAVGHLMLEFAYLTDV